MMKIKFRKQLTLLLMSFCLVQMVSAKDITPDRQVVYKTVDSVALKLDIFQPEGYAVTDQRPTIIFFFGGGWSSGTPKQFYEQAQALADKGMLAISADYRVAKRNKTTPFDAVTDAKSAVRWVRQHAGELGVDPDRIVTSGGSAGGHVAACTGVIEGFEAQGEDVLISSVPNAMILFNPVLDTTEKGYGLKKVTEARKTEISPCHHVHSGIVPTIIFHGTADTTVPFENIERFTQLMKEAGNTCDLVPYVGANHGFFNGSYFRPKTKDTSAYESTLCKSIAFLSSLGYIE